MKTRSTGRMAVTSLALAGASLAALGWSLAGAAAAQTQPAPASEDARVQALEAEVRQLVAEVRELKAAQTAAAQASQSATGGTIATRAASDGQAPGASSAEPRTAQNATGGFSTPGQTAEASPDVGEPRVAQNSTHRLLLQSADGGYSIGLTGVVQFDAGDYLNFKATNASVGPQELSNGVNARRARIGVVGTAPGGWSFAFVYDAGNSQDTASKGIETAQLVYGGLKGSAFELGYSNTFFTLDQSTSANDLLFLERSTPSNIATNFNTGDNRANAGARFFGDRYWAGAYVTGPAIGDSHTLTAERFGAFERVAVQALRGKDYSLHLGFGADQLVQAPNSGNGTPDTLTLNDQPELRIDPTTLLNTGAIGTAAHPVTGGHVYDLETAASWKGLFWQGEYYWYDVERSGLAANNFEGWYGQVAWTLTGETHTYNPQAGSYFRIYPSHPFSLSKGEWGAWEVAARVDYVNLNSNFVSGTALSANPDAVDGGAQRGITAGLNWYPNDLIRFMVDYNHIDYDKENGTAVTGAKLGVPVGATFDAISFRGQVAF
jgi:phosphate-selective porin OprO/OprP